MKDNFTQIDDVKIYIDNIPPYIAETFYLLYNHNKLMGNKIFQLSNYDGDRKQFINRLVEGYLHNYNNVREILNAIMQEISVTPLLDLRINPNDNLNTTLKDFWYLRRDWCYYKEGEEQISTIVNSIKEVISENAYKKSLFLGCGTGRLSVDLADLFEKVYSLDKSYSMIWHIKELMKREQYEFYQPRNKNVLTLDNVAQKHSAYIDEERKRIIQSKVDFFVADIFNLPFDDNEIDCVFSIYFTDVIALKLWFGKIDQVLKKKGLFIHFGPLDYFFSDETEMFTAEEIRAYFEKNNYTTLIDSVVETPHLEDSNFMSHQVYKNWFFVAEKQS
ncbi:class I SAM-dependent methyltransferase [Moheibacter lacus]|uniref:carnosine N-methyltransferase n=1 Tax=Moheibacter lacus TaxID=2745851 RepID=A0A838ZMZ6_9FLAO|nr:class I SAM-dependent methyltransferase [Moheibacter lacus]MBA5629230.1 class I SAM-dependent methyltransferase [Moheibacter lacus]